MLADLLLIMKTNGDQLFEAQIHGSDGSAHHPS